MPFSRSRSFSRSHHAQNLPAPRTSSSPMHPSLGRTPVVRPHPRTRTVHLQTLFTCQRTFLDQAPRPPRKRGSDHRHPAKPDERLPQGFQPTPPQPRAVGQNPKAWWRWTDSNRRPPACKAGALPLSYTPLALTGGAAIDGFAGVFGQARRGIAAGSPPCGLPTALSGGAAIDGFAGVLARPSGGSPARVRFAAASACGGSRAMVGRAGFEPATPRLSSVCSDQLSYQPLTPRQNKAERPPGPSSEILGKG